MIAEKLAFLTTLKASRKYTSPAQRPPPPIGYRFLRQAHSGDTYMDQFRIVHRCQAGQDLLLGQTVPG